MWSLIGPGLGAVLAAAQLTAPIGALGTNIRFALDLSTGAMIGAVLVSYVLAAAVMFAPGYLLGRRWPTAAAAPALVLFIIGNVMIQLTPGPGLLTAGRIIVGLGAGTLLGTALALSGQLGPARSPARLVLGILLGAALLLAPVVSGILARSLSFRWAFLIDVPVAVLALVLTAATGIAMLIMRASRSRPPATPAPAMPSPTPPVPPTPGADNPQT